MEKLKLPKGVEIDISLEWQKGTKNKPFKMIGLSKNEAFKPIYKYGFERYHWIYLFKYESGGMFTIEIDYDNKFYKHEQISN